MKKLLPWFAVLVLLMVIFGTVYGVVQQAQRNDANYPQIQLAEDTAVQLNRHDPFLDFAGDKRVDMAASLAPFTIIYNKQAKPVSGTGYLNGRLPQVPKDMLEAARGKEYHAVTWQPQPKVRIAAVTVAAKDSYVLSGRNLREVEKNETTTLQLSLLGGIAAMFMLAVVFVLSGLTEDY
jgi:hypothetical protein